jgi:hypothetical protein
MALLAGICLAALAAARAEGEEAGTATPPATRTFQGDSHASAVNSDHPAADIHP